MWYQVVSPPNMPWSRLSSEGKVHSATVKEATAERDQQRPRLHLRGLDLVGLGGAPCASRAAAATEPDRDADDDDPAEP